MRYHDYSNSDDAVLWQLGLGYKPHGQEFVRLRFSYGRSIQEPSLLELYGFFPDRFTPNPDLKPEFADSVEGGVDVDLSSLLKATLIEKLTLSGTGFALYIKDEISGFSTPINNEGTGKRLGAETALELQLGKFFFIDSIAFSSSYTYTDARTSSGDAPAKPP